MAITVGSVEVDVVPNTRGIYAHLQSALVPAATRAGAEAGRAAGRAFGPAMAGAVPDSVADRIGRQLGQQIGRQIVLQVSQSLRQGVTAGGQLARGPAARAGDEAGGAFSRSLKAKLELAFRSLPRLNIDANTSEIDADLQALRVRMQTLADKRIGIDISATDAKAEIRQLQAELTRLGAEHPNVQVRADTAAAQAQLAAVLGEIDAVDGRRAEAAVHVDVSGALSALAQLSFALVGVAALPVVPVAAAGLGALAASATAAGVGVGALAAVALPAFSGIRNALTAQKAAQEEATTATSAGGQAASQAASKALQLAGAQQALAAAERNGARQVTQAQQQVVQARQAAADAVTQASQRNAQAARQIQDAEKQLAAAQKDARQAQLDLTAARKQAGQELEDLANRYVDAQLSQRDAALAVQQAQLELQKTLADPKATQLQRDQARLAYDQAVQRLREQTTETKRLGEQQAAAAKAGVDGTNTVRQAQDRLAKAQQQVADRTQAVRDAQAQAAQVQVGSARQVAQAQEKASEATANVAVAQQAAADAVASAQRQIQSAQLSTASSAGRASTAQGKYAAALMKLSPAARDTMAAFIDLRSAFSAWSRSLQPAVMPLFTRALEGIRNSLPGLTPLVLGAARAVETLQAKASAGFRSPWWQTFKKDLAASVQPALVGLGVAFGNLFKGMVGIVDAFLPHIDGISGRMERLTARFANWGTSLRGSPAFERFLAYSAQMGPRVAEALGKIAGAFLAVGTALAPLSGPALSVLGAVADAIGWLATTVPEAVVAVYGLFLVTRLWTVAQAVAAAAAVAWQGAMILATLLTDGWTAAIFASNAAFAANPIVVVVVAIIAALALLVGAVVYAWNHWAWFRNGVLAVWDAIKTAALWVWANALQPTFSAIWIGLQAVGAAAMWLWTHAIGPAFSAIWTAARVLFAIVVVAVVTPIILAFRFLAKVAMWLWTDSIKPAFQAIATIALWLWRYGIEPTIDGIVDAFRFVARVGMWLWENALAPAFRGIASVATWLWRNAIGPAFNGIGGTITGVWQDHIRPTFNALKSSLGSVGDAFDTGVGYMGRAWAKLKDLTRGPVKFIVETVYNGGIVPVWNAVADVVHLDRLDPVHFARGGTVPGYAPRQDRVPAFLSPGEGVLVPEAVRALGGAGAIAAINSWGRSGVQHFADGGVVGDIWRGITGAAKTVGGWAGSAWDILTDPAKIWGKAIKPTLRLAERVGTSKWARAIGKMPVTLAIGLKDKLVKGVTNVFGDVGSFTGGGGSGVSRWTDVVEQALRMLGQPLSYVGITLRRMNQESGGNPTIVNKWDSNWIAGHPSVGLMQVIGPTFDAYAGPMRNVGPKLYGVSVNPLANVVASMRYALAAYGSLPAAYNRAGGYDSGGWLPSGGFGYNGLSDPEAVLTPRQWATMSTLAARGAQSTPPDGGTFEGNLYLDSGEFMGKVHGVMAQRDAQLVATLRAGRR